MKPLFLFCSGFTGVNFHKLLIVLVYSWSRKLHFLLLFDHKKWDNQTEHYPWVLSHHPSCRRKLGKKKCLSRTATVNWDTGSTHSQHHFSLVNTGGVQAHLVFDAFPSDTYSAKCKIVITEVWSQKAFFFFCWHVCQVLI